MEREDTACSTCSFTCVGFSVSLHPQRGVENRQELPGGGALSPVNGEGLVRKMAALLTFLSGPTEQKRSKSFSKQLLDRPLGRVVETGTSGREGKEVRGARLGTSCPVFQHREVNHWYSWAKFKGIAAAQPASGTAGAPEMHRSCSSNMHCCRAGLQSSSERNRSEGSCCLAEDLSQELPREASPARTRTSCTLDEEEARGSPQLAASAAAAKAASKGSLGIQFRLLQLRGGAVQAWLAGAFVL